MKTAKELIATDIEVVPRTQQEIDDYGPKGIQFHPKTLVGMEQRKTQSFPFIEPVQQD
jgi:hypothetical protein